MSNDKQVPKTPARGRKKNGSLEELDTQFQEASTDRTAQEAEAQQASTSKRSAADKTSEETVEKRSKRVTRQKSPERQSTDSEDSSDSDKSSDTSSNSDSSSDESSKRATKTKGFILFRNNPLVTVGNRGSLRKMARLLKAQASLMDDVDRKGKDAFVENYDEVRENLTFTRELIRSIKQDFPDHKLKKPTLVNLGKLGLFERTGQRHRPLRERATVGTPSFGLDRKLRIEESSWEGGVEKDSDGGKRPEEATQGAFHKVAAFSLANLEV